MKFSHILFQIKIKNYIDELVQISFSLNLQMNIRLMKSTCSSLHLSDVIRLNKEAKNR